jgi:hypothetical protein
LQNAPEYFERGLDKFSLDASRAGLPDQICLVIRVGANSSQEAHDVRAFFDETGMRVCAKDVLGKVPNAEKACEVLQDRMFVATVLMVDVVRIFQQHAQRQDAFTLDVKNVRRHVAFEDLKQPQVPEQLRQASFNFASVAGSSTIPDGSAWSTRVTAL